MFELSDGPKPLPEIHVDTDNSFEFANGNSAIYTPFRLDYKAQHRAGHPARARAVAHRASAEDPIGCTL
jgi:hypothetical protein